MPITNDAISDPDALRGVQGMGNDAGRWAETRDPKIIWEGHKAGPSLRP